MTQSMTLSAIEITGSAPGPRLLITGGVHGDEFEPMAAIRRLIRELKPEKLSGTVVLVPVVNEPAFLQGSRTAEDQLDLARVCPGKPDGSITERVAHALSKLIRGADYYIDLHTGGTTLSVLPLAGYSLHPDSAILDAQRRMARAMNLGVVWGTSPLPGRSLSVAFEANIPAIYAEYLGAATCTEEGIAAYVDGCMNVMGELGMLDRQPPASRVQHVVEDNRPGSGHMQVQNPSPLTGFFEPAVRLGASIRAGDTLGTVSDPLGNRTETIRSQQTGIVLVLRTFNRVREGESLGVILELPLPESKV